MARLPGESPIDIATPAKDAAVVRALLRRIEVLESKNAAGLVLIGGTNAPAFANGYTNYNSATFSAAGYWVDANGAVHLQGMVSTAAAVAATIFTLPAGFRPSKASLFSTLSYGPANYVPSRVDVNADGTVRAEVTGTLWLCLDGISFLAAG